MKKVILFAVAILSCSLLTAQHIHSEGAQFDRAEYGGDTITVKTKIPILDNNNLLNYFADLGDLLDLVPLPNLSNYITKDGDDVITGIKSFTKPLVLQNADTNSTGIRNYLIAKNIGKYDVNGLLVYQESYSDDNGASYSDRGKNTSFGFGIGALSNNKGSSNLGIGTFALSEASTIASIGIGGSAGRNATGSSNIFMGSVSGSNNEGKKNVFIGDWTGTNNVGNYNVALGYESLAYNAGHVNTSIGYRSGQEIVGNNNISIGPYSALKSSGNNNISIGPYSGELSLASYNIGIGSNSLRNAFEPYNIGIGTNTLENSKGRDNVVLGHDSYTIPPVSVYQKVFDGNSWDLTANSIVIISHGFGSNGTQFFGKYTKGAFDSKVSGLNPGSTYLFEVVDSNTIHFVDKDIYGSQPTGSDYAIDKMESYDKVNILGNDIEPTKSNQTIVSTASMVMPESIIDSVLNDGAKAVLTREVADQLYGVGNSGISSVVAGDGIVVDNTDTENPVVSSTGLEAIDEGNGVAFALIGLDKNNYGNRGLSAVDLSTYNYVSSANNRGALGDWSFAAGSRATASGKNSISIATDQSTATASRAVSIGAGDATGNSSIVLTNSNAEASGVQSTIIGNGLLASGTSSGIFNSNNSSATGNYSNALASYSSTASGAHSVVIAGRTSTAPSYAEIAFGQYITPYAPVSATAWNSSDRLFIIGKGNAVNSLSDALTILKNGQMGIDIDNFEANTTGSKLQVNGAIENTAADGALILKSSDGSRWKIKVDNSGVISATSL